MQSSRLKYQTKSRKLILKAEQYVKLKDLFESKHWKIEESLEISYFNRYVHILGSLSEEQQNFLINLTSQFLHIPQTGYLEYLINPIRKLRANHPDENLIFACCLPEKDVGKIKSSAAVLYQFKGTTIRSKVDMGKYYVVDKFTSELVNATDLSKSHFVLVDDFIGTGETALSAIGYIRELYPALVDNSKISILSIVAMRRGKEIIERSGSTVYASVIRTRGISDYYTGTELFEAQKLMSAIEQTLKRLKPEFSFGYGQSEALVSMERCPNNTFPIYWYLKNAPYER